MCRLHPLPAYVVAFCLCFGPKAIPAARGQEPDTNKPLSVEEINRGIQAAAQRARAEEGRDDPVPPENEIVMTPGMKITATTRMGTITITAGKGLKRCYTWQGATRCVNMWPRKERWNGSLGIYFPGTGYHWKEHNGYSRGLVQEGQLHFDNLIEAQKWIEERKSVTADDADPPRHCYVYRDDGLMVHWAKMPEIKAIMVEVWQIYIAHNKPTRLDGSADNMIIVKTASESNHK